MLVQGSRLRAVTNTVANRTEDAPKMEHSLRVELLLTVTVPRELRGLPIADSPFQARTRLEPLFPTSLPVLRSRTSYRIRCLVTLGL